MGKKERQQRSQSKNQRGNSKISRQNNHFEHKKNGKPQHAKQDRRAKNEYQRPSKPVR